MPRCRKPAPKHAATPDPIVYLTGCRAWPVTTPVWRGPCPVCRGNTARATRLEVCLWCSATSPPLARLIVSRETGVTNSMAAGSRQAERDAAEGLAKSYPVRLTEGERRQIYRGKLPAGVVRDHPSVANLAAIGRAWLKSIGQEPDWDLVPVVVAKGKVRWVRGVPEAEFVTDPVYLQEDVTQVSGVPAPEPELVPL